MTYRSKKKHDDPELKKFPFTNLEGKFLIVTGFFEGKRLFVVVGEKQMFYRTKIFATTYQRYRGVPWTGLAHFR